MPEICNHAEPTSQTNDIHNFPLAIYEIRDGHSWKKANQSRVENLHGRTNKLFHQVGIRRSISPSQRYQRKKLCVEEYNLQIRSSE